MLRLNFRKFIAAAVTAAVAFSVMAFPGIGGPVGTAFADAGSEGFVITDYQVNADVSADRVYSITETITCDFSESRHGIYRCIPTSMNVLRADGSSDRVKAKVKNFDADVTWEKDSDHQCSGDASSYYTVRLGDADRTVTGEQTYRISYDYVCSGDGMTDADEFYFNIIGSGWETDIEHVSFNIEMPKNFDTDKVGFSMGGAGIMGIPEGQLSYETEGRTITGETLRTLYTGESLTIRIELPEGYFTTQKPGIGYIVIYVITIILALISVILCRRWGRDEKIIPVIQFEPPKGYNSLDVGVMDHLDPRSGDVLSLLVYLADRGYLSIEPLPDRHGNRDNPKDFRFLKLKEYDGDNICEREFLAGLFKDSSSVNSYDLENSFYKTIQLVSDLEKDFTAKLVSRKGRLPLTLMIIGAALIMCLPALEYGGLIDYLFGMTGAEYIGFAVGLACIIVMIICWAFIQRRTPLGVELGGVAKGFAEFLETAEKDRIEQLIEDEPQSFYRIIPYAMVLGVSDKWIKKFKGMTLQTPSWYIYDSPVLEAYMIGRFLSFSLDGTMKNVSAAPASSGGGGISGGGVGGGGGGSW